MSNGRFVVLVLLALNTLALVAQVLVDFSTVNLASSCVVYASSVAVLLYLLWTPAIHTHPLSTFVIFGFCFTTHMGALLGQSAFVTSLAANLRQPVETFGALAGFQLLALLAHSFYRHVFGGQKTNQVSLVRGILDAIGLYKPPGTGALWLMGVVGLFAFLVGGSREGAFFKVLQGMAFLTWAPYLIPMYFLQEGPGYCQIRKQTPKLLIYMSLIVLLGLAANGRGIMFSGFMTIGLFVLLKILQSKGQVAQKRIFQAGLLSVIGLAAAVPLSDLATAMVVARNVRGSISAPQMVQETFHYLARPDVLKAEKDRQEQATQTGYDEFYFQNPVMARLVETKFQDNAMYFAGTLSDSDKEALAETTLKMLMALFPQPVVDVFGWRLDKLDYRYTMGDYLAYLSAGIPLGGLKTGSMLAQGWALMGPLYIGVYFVFLLAAFAVLDLFGYSTGGGRLYLSGVAMLSIWKLFQYGVSAESFHHWVGYFVRTLPQNTVIFLAFAFLARVPGLLWGGNKRRPAPTPPLTG